MDEDIHGGPSPTSPLAYFSQDDAEDPGRELGRAAVPVEGRPPLTPLSFLTGSWDYGPELVSSCRGHVAGGSI